MSISEAVRSAMQQTNELFNAQVIGARDVEALDHVYTTNAKVLPPGANLLRSRAEAKAFWRQAIDALGIQSAVLSTVEAEQAGDGVVEIGKAELGLAGGASVEVKYVVHWKQEDGEWKWDLDIWNMNQ